MRFQGSNIHLTYCTNVHYSSDWKTCLNNITYYGVRLKEKLAKRLPFGIGLRLSHSESLKLLEGENLSYFREKLTEKDLYVFTINGFPYGDFHRGPIKAQVHYPDWRTKERLYYTLNLVNILAQLLPQEEGSISTSPLTYKPWIKDKKDFWLLLVKNLMEVVYCCVLLREKTGKLIHIDIEPEPDGLLETTKELIVFFKDHLLQKGISLLCKKLHVQKSRVEEWIYTHIRVCYDVCHASVMYENPIDVIASYQEAGVKIGKMQISSALKVTFDKNSLSNQKKIAELKAFDEPVYLHQVCEKRNDTLLQYSDLSKALITNKDQFPGEWRIHFHVPVFINSYTLFSSTQEDLVVALEILKKRPFTNHLEIETYTWEVLPPYLKINLLDSIYREYKWVLKNLLNG